VKEIPGIFEGPILKTLSKLAFPIFAGMVFQLAYNITDTIWISRIDLGDPSYVGGVGLVFPIIFIAIAIGSGILIGTSSLVARAIGRKDTGILNRTAESSLVIAGVFSLFMFVLGYGLGDRLVGLLGAFGDYRVHALEYLYYITPGAVVMFLLHAFNGILQGEGLMKKVMVAMIIGTVANIILDPVFIFVLKLNVRGAAIATCLAQFLALGYVVSVFLRGQAQVKIEWRVRNIDFAVIKEIAGVGLPQTLSQVLMSLGFLIFNRIVVGIDPLALTAFSLVGRFDQVVLIPIFAISSALLTMMGQNWGRGIHERVKRIWRTGLLSGGVVVASLAAIMVSVAPFIYPFFSGLDEVVRYAVIQTRIMEFSFVLAVAGILARSAFQAMGNPLPALVITALRLLGIAVPAVYLYVFVFDWGIYGVFLGIITGNAVGAIIGLLWVPRSMAKKSQAASRLGKLPGPFDLGRLGPHSDSKDRPSPGLAARSDSGDPP